MCVSQGPDAEIRGHFHCILSVSWSWSVPWCRDWGQNLCSFVRGGSNLQLQNLPHGLLKGSCGILRTTPDTEK